MLDFTARSPQVACEDGKQPPGATKVTMACGTHNPRGPAACRDLCSEGCTDKMTNCATRHPWVPAVPRNLWGEGCKGGIRLQCSGSLGMPAYPVTLAPRRSCAEGCVDRAQYLKSTGYQESMGSAAPVVPLQGCAGRTLGCTMQNA